MLSPFYKVVAEQLRMFFAHKAVNQEIGRYYMELPSEEYMKQVVDALQSLEEASIFVYESPDGTNEYKTIALHFGDTKFVIASTLDNTHVDFMVTLRNEMSEQQGCWKNASILMISNKKLDSIRGGSVNLTAEGFPLHSSSMVGNILTMVNESKLPKHNKEMLYNYLEQRDDMHHIQNVSFLDFEDLLTWVNQEEMTTEDFKMINYFKDPQLEKLIEARDIYEENSRDYKNFDREIQKRLNDNQTLFEDITRIRELGNAEDLLKENFDSSMGRKLLKEDDSLTFEEINKAKEKVESIKMIAYKPEEVKIWRVEDADKEVLVKTYWKMKSRIRTYDFVIFIPEVKAGQQLKVKLPFTSNTKQEYINDKSKIFTKAMGHSLEVILNLKAGSTFVKSDYKHENMTKGAYSFRFLVLPIVGIILAGHDNSFSLNTKGHLVLELKNEYLVFGEEPEAELELQNKDEIVEIPEGGLKLRFAPDILDVETSKLAFPVKIEEAVFTIEIEDEGLSSFPVTPFQVWQRKMSKKVNVEYTSFNQRIMIGDQPLVIKKEFRYLYEIEEQWVKESWHVAKKDLLGLHAKKIVMPESLAASYHAFLEYFKVNNTIPSFAFYNEELSELAKEYVEAFIEAIESIQEGENMSQGVRDILYLGTLQDFDVLYMAPFSPLNVVYQLMLTNELAGCDVDYRILSKLNAAYTIPYLINELDEVYKPRPNSSQAEWHEYRPKIQVSIGETNKYLSQVVEEKLRQFFKYYEYLFILTNKPEILINIINIENDIEILRGIVQWFKHEIKRRKSLQGLPIIKIVGSYVDDNNLTAFESFNNMNNAEKLKTLFDIDCKTINFDAIDVFQVIQSNLVFIKKSISEPYEYSHLTFYKMLSKESVSTQNVRQAPNALNLDGLYVTPTSKRTEQGGYRIGFGIGGSNVQQSQLSRFATKVNELSTNRRNKGTNAYHKDEMLCLHIDGDDEAFLKTLYNQSIWLVFIDPVVDLEYFQESSENLVIVHYSDQLSSSNHYDAITVTNKSEQYYSVIEEFFAKQGIVFPKENLDQVIKAFNTFNGEWLLRAVQGVGHDQREKMSIVAAIKYMLIELNEQHDILWVPVSMEEIVRVAGNVRLNKKDSIFSSKLIGQKGSLSDDLLMIGIKLDQNKLYMHLYPIEVKIGHNPTAVIAKGTQQLTNLTKALKQELIINTGFEAKFMRNFFAKLFIVNARKMEMNAFWPEKSYKLDEKTVELLLNDKFVVTENHQATFNIGAIVSFRKDAHVKSKDTYNDVTVYEIPERISYKAIGMTIEELKKDDYSRVILIEPTREEKKQAVDLPEYLTKPTLLVETTLPPETPTELYKVTPHASNVAEVYVETYVEKMGIEEAEAEAKEKESTTKTETIDETALAEVAVTSLKELTEVDEVGIEDEETKQFTTIKVPVKEFRPLFGHLQSTEQPIYWEFGHSQLNNRHLIIGGRSGEGKTYFIQSLLLQLAEVGQSSVIIDYSASYTKTKLDKKFIEVLGDSIHERIVYDDKLPINPFLRREFYTNNGFRVEKSYEVAGRVSAIFESVFSFGPQQVNALYTAIKGGIDKYLEAFTMQKLLVELKGLEDISSSTLASIVNKLQQLVDIDPFDYNEQFTWDDYYKKVGQISIIQFDGFDQDNIKKLMTELLLWEIWYYAQRGNEKQPLPVVLDEAQNLNFKSGSPSDKILREGRKFGITAWFATQSFINFKAAEMGAIENAATSIYFHPIDSDFKGIAEKLYLEKRDLVLLHGLGKGECFVRGKFLLSTGELSKQTIKMIKVPPME
ncbi:DNA phosphorothioation-dependent restriction protein DptH [Metabacillus idriensis]|uniref:DNA phosphorothioation-dependent restriction protein DptH n=1 Tax=Metabacillus idriensis TaxID=324768 RepID=UPI0028144A0A|nr:DNA phosphorothioation-dependent restriction protein DptH [Metabacillus idriensis]MDR0136693.1 DNA phosphorothioation-dependent restriction protein DptH [Metabacillus idriensis]